MNTNCEYENLCYNIIGLNYQARWMLLGNEFDILITGNAESLTQGIELFDPVRALNFALSFNFIEEACWLAIKL